ncbi:MAG: hypothetical protein IAF02_03025 [Anaerolineae bacterium]|nr:hypothetical protein [Anaerolineae bacterium]
MSQDSEIHSNNASKLLILMGFLWLVLGGGLIFYQLVKPPSVTVQWNTETELNTAGFNLYRSEIDEDNYVLVNDVMIDSEGSAISGATYSYVDSSVEAGKTFYYLLEEIQNDGTANQYEDDKFSYTVPGMTGWSVVLAALSIVVGLGLLVIGIKEIKS